MHAFVDSPELVGERYQGKYLVVTTSGTTGKRGIFLQDDRSLAVTNVLAVRILRDWLRIGDVARIALGGAHLAMVNATGGHFASATAAARRRKSRLRTRVIQVFSVHTPCPS